MGIVTMPKMGDTMQEGSIAQWYKQVGDKIAEGEAIAEIETEKASIDIEVFESGTIAELIVEPGQVVPVGAPIARIENGQGGAAPMADAPAGMEAPPATAQPTTPSEPSAPTPPATPVMPPPTVEETTQAAPDAAPGRRIVASPLARRLALENNVDLRHIRGTGPSGRIVAEDVQAFAQGKGSRLAPQPAISHQPSAVSPVPARQPAPAPTGDVWTAGKPASQMRKVIARRLSESKQQIPHFYATIDIDMVPAMALREQLNARGDDFVKLSPNDIVIKAVADVLRAQPAMRLGWGGDSILTTDRVNIGVAVALPDGLIVPVIRDADRKTLNAIALEVRALAEKARAGKLMPDEYAGGTFSVSNLGMFGVEDFCAIVNPPEPGILAVGGIAQVPVVKDGQIVPGTRMKVTLSADHRIIDGAVGAQFLQELKRRLENPLLLLQ